MIISNFTAFVLSDSLNFFLYYITIVLKYILMLLVYLSSLLKVHPVYVRFGNVVTKTV